MSKYTFIDYKACTDADMSKLDNIRKTGRIASTVTTAVGSISAGYFIGKGMNAGARLALKAAGIPFDENGKIDYRKCTAKQAAIATLGVAAVCCIDIVASTFATAAIGDGVDTVAEMVEMKAAKAAGIPTETSGDEDDEVVVEA